MAAGMYASLVPADKVGQVTLFFEHCITQSFVTDQIKASITEAEVKRRFQIVDKIFGQLRGDLHWSLDKIYELAPQYVRDELDGVKWEPAKGASWVVPGG